MQIRRLEELLTYEPETGLFYWKCYRGRNARLGQVAGTINAAGYVQITVDGKIHYGHRLAWAFAHGCMPALEIDHKDGDPSNNRIKNLRAASSSQQKFNARLRKDNPTGVKGVSYDSYRDKFVARVRAGGRCVLHKRYNTLDEAEAAVRKARCFAHQDYANHGRSNGDSEL